MSPWLILAIALAWLTVLAGGWLGWQLLRQNGRVLLRLDELENRLNELEFGGADEPQGLPFGCEAPAFELADLAGARQSLAQFRRQPLVLLFFNPDCGFCREMMPKLAAVAPQTPGSAGISAGALLPAEAAGKDAGAPGISPSALVVILTSGDADKNRQFFAEHKVACPVLLQNDGEVAKAYQVNGTPAGYLVSADGKIASELALGAEALLKLAAQPAQGLLLTPALSPSDGERIPRNDFRALAPGTTPLPACGHPLHRMERRGKGEERLRVHGEGENTRRRTRGSFQSTLGRAQQNPTRRVEGRDVRA